MKIIVIGCPGSGKSFFSKNLSEKTKIPVYHMDNIFWNEDRTSITKIELMVSVEKIMESNQWIIDGNYISTMEVRIKNADTIIYLDYTTEQCMHGIKERVGKKRDDMPWIEDEVSKELVDFVKSFNTSIKPEIHKLLESYQHKEIKIFKNREEAYRYLDQF